MVRLGKVHGNLMVDLQVTCEKLQGRAERILQSMLEIDGEEAASLLAESDGHVKTALVMKRLNVDAEEARRRLEEAGGFIARVVEGPR